jgi:hypothetical protein
VPHVSGWILALPVPPTCRISTLFDSWRASGAKLPDSRLSWPSPHLRMVVRDSRHPTLYMYRVWVPWMSPNHINLYGSGPWMSPNHTNLYGMGPWMSPRPPIRGRIEAQAISSVTGPRPPIRGRIEAQAISSVTGPRPPIRGRIEAQAISFVTGPRPPIRGRIETQAISSVTGPRPPIRGRIETQAISSLVGPRPPIRGRIEAKAKAISFVFKHFFKFKPWPWQSPGKDPQSRPIS